MEMESSRRPQFDRSIELNSVKKPRISPANTGKSTYQELVNQYKTALAELTFNSKPIITNLTIIAGENTHAACAIAATICDHILEVPSEQKLPSLYLLDSIVKNIGRDYIKYIATRLPEVFCKAYKQVDPSIHSGMRHLFGTWKGVFPPQQLQIIEMELGFSTSVNGSASAASKTDSQTQLQPRSIHVNPKYLAARQRLQQANQPQVNDNSGAESESSEDIERIGDAGVERSWADPSVKIHNIQQSQAESSLQKQGGRGYGDNGFTSGIKRPLTTSVGKPIGQGYEKRWLGTSVKMEESVSTQRNGHGVQHGVPNYMGTKVASTVIPLLQNLPGSSVEMSKSWKNSEEEEYKCDGLGSRATNPGPVDKLGFNDSNFGVPATAASVSKAIVGQLNQTSGGQSVVRQHPQPLLISKRDPRQSLLEKDFMKSQYLARTDPRSTSVSAQPNMGLHALPSRHQNSHPGSSQKTQSQTLQKSSYVVSSLLRSVSSSEHLPSQETEITHIVPKAQKVLSTSSPKTVSSPDRSNPLIGDSPEQSNVNLLAAVMKSELITGAISGPRGAECSATMSSGSLGGVNVSASQRKVVKPPLPPGLSNSSPLIASTPAQTSKKASGDSNPLSILSTLMSKGLIAGPKTEETAPALMLSEGRLSEQSPTVATVTIPPVLKISVAVPAPTNDETSLSEVAEKVPGIFVHNTNALVKNIIGFDFKPHLLRECHPAVVDRLFDDLPHRCDVCGLCFELQERLTKHSLRHAFKNSIENCLNRPSRRWYSNTTDWITGNAGFPFGYNFTFSSMESSRTAKDDEKMVPANESQCVCLLCGELFEDFYSQESNEWAFKGAVYIPNMSRSTEAGTSNACRMHNNMIVHSNCMSDDAIRELGLVSGIKVEKKV